MNTLVKKEIRLLLPSWIVAVLLALPPICTRSDDGIPVFLLFFGLTIMALTSFGREASLNTFSQMLSQPADRMRVWQIKLSTLAVAFLTVFGAWRLATILSWHDYGGNPADPDEARAVLVAGCLIFVATFTGGLWSTLLLRQLAAAFWLTLLVPATLCGFTAAFFAGKDLDYYIIAMVCVIIGIYSVGGFLFARWLYFRAQDVGWSGLIIALPEWKFTRSETAEEIRRRRPIFALVKKEFQLQQGVFTGVAGLFVLHCGIIALRTFHHFEKDSAGEILTSIFWMLWLIVPVILGSMAVAEERKLGVMEGQLCLPASRRVQFVIKGFLTLLLGIFLGGVIPIALETIGRALGGHNQIFEEDNHRSYAFFLMGFAGSAALLSLVSFYASTLAKNFLQAVGFALVTFTGCVMIVPVLTNNHMLFFDSIARSSLLQAIIAVPTIIVTLLCLAYLNFKNFRDGWPLWRRNLLGVVGAFVFVIAASAGIYNRAWEVFEPAEPAHNPAKLSLSNPPVFLNAPRYNLLLRLPDGRVWFDYFGYRPNDISRRHWPFTDMFRTLRLKSAGPWQFFSGSNWVSATAGYVYESAKAAGSQKYVLVYGYLDSVGIKSDGTLWASDKSDQNAWTADKLTQFGNETNWQQVVRPFNLGWVLLKKDGTLWRWGTNHFDFEDWPEKWPGLRNFPPRQIGTNADWSEIFSAENDCFSRKTDGTVWRVMQNENNRKHGFTRATNYDQVVSRKLSGTTYGYFGAWIRKDGTLWFSREVGNYAQRESEFETLQSGKETNWVAVAVTWEWMIALKSDGTLWKWNRAWQGSSFQASFTAPPTRLGIHDDWVAITSVEAGVISLAADGSLWFWPRRDDFVYPRPLLKLPKQPQFLGNVFAKED